MFRFALRTVFPRVVGTWGFRKEQSLTSTTGPRCLEIRCVPIQEARGSLSYGTILILILILIDPFWSSWQPRALLKG